MKKIRKTGILVIALAMLGAAAGVVYAHWTETLTVEADVSTGTMDINFVVGTDDDGIVGNDFSGSDDGTQALYDHWGAASSADPAGMYRYNSGTNWEGYVNPYGFPRYDKDVGKCTATFDAATNTLSVELVNGYPSYFCTLFYDVVNDGSVPVKLQSTSFSLSKDGGPAAVLGFGLHAGEPGWATTTGLPFASFDGVPELAFDGAKGMWCGTQLDPGEAYSDQFDPGDAGMVFWIHIEQGVDNSTMGQTYRFDWDLEFVNWNEWDVAGCPAGTVKP